MELKCDSKPPMSVCDGAAEIVCALVAPIDCRGRTLDSTSRQECIRQREVEVNAVKSYPLASLGIALSIAPVLACYIYADERISISPP